MSFEFLRRAVYAALRVKRLAVSSICALVLALGVASAWAQGCPGCNLPSAHPVDSCSIGGSNGDPVVAYGRGSDGLNVSAVLIEACSRYATAHSNAAVVASWSSCAPRIPDPGMGSFGGSWGSYLVDGTIESRDAKSGKLISSTTGAWSLATCGCSDSRNMNLVGLGNDGSCYCTYGQFWDDSIRACVPAPPPVLTIDLLGASSTKALPAGPALPQTAHVSQNGAAAPGKAVSISLADGSAFSAVTDSGGNVQFTYVPPLSRTVVQVSATCSGCSNTAQKTITVEPCDLCEGKQGNPVSPATGEKEQYENDWQDSGVHPLSFTRQYRSYGNIDAGLGAGWSHNFAAAVSRSDLDATVRFGDGVKVLFGRRNGASAWVADNKRDLLAETPLGLVYTRAGDESRWAFDTSGKLLSVTQRNGWMMTMTYNAAGRLASVTNAFGRSLQFSYDAAGRLSNVATPEGQGLSYGYNGAGRLVYRFLPDGAGRTYVYEDARWPMALTGIYDEAGARYASFAYDIAGRAISTQHAGGTQAYTLSYPAPAASSGRLVAGSAVDPSIYRLTTQTMDPLGNSQSQTFQGGDGQVRLVGVNGAFEGAQMASRTLTGGSLPETETDFLGVQTMYTWDLARQLKVSTTRAASRPEAQTIGTQWHPTLRLPILVTEAGRITASSYDGAGNKLSETVTDVVSGQVRTTQWTYTAQGLVSSMTDPKGAVWRYGYDSVGNRTSVTNPLNQQAGYGFDAAGRVTRQAETNGMVTTYAYDARGRLTSQTRGGETSGFSYTPTGLLASATLPNGYQVTYSYDAAQRLVGAVDNRGAQVQYTLDGMGNRVREEVRDSSGSIAWVTGRAINSLNKVAAIQGAAGQTTALAYDANGEPVAQTDPLNQTTRQTLDGLRRPVATTFADNASVTQAWNQLDQLTRVTDPKGVATGYQTNAFGEVMAETSPDIGSVSYQRNAAGEVIGSTDAVGNQTSLERDALGRPTTIQYAPDQLAAFSYDQGQVGYLSKIDDKAGTTSYVRDAQGRILSKTQSVNDNPANPSRFKVQYGYANGELTSLTYPSGLKVFYNRSAGRITGIDVQPPSANPLKPKPVVPFVTGLAHTALGQPKAWSWAGGDSATRSFDTDGRMTSSEFASYQYDAASRITGITQRLWASRTVAQGTRTVTELYTTPLSWSAGYDSRNRLTSLVRSGAETRYTYDANSNRLSAIDQVTSDTDLDGLFDADDFSQTTSQSLSLDAASNKLLGFTQTVTKVKGTRTQSITSSQVHYALDANGAMTSDGLRSFEYDASGRLSKVKIVRGGEAAKLSYLHNALGQRVFKSEVTAEQTLPNQSTLGLSFMDWLKKNFQWMFTQAQASTSIGMAFVYDEDGNLLGEYDNGSSAGKGRQEYIWLPTEDGQAVPIGIYKGTRVYAVHADHLGTPRLITDEDNKPVWQWPYSAFGNNKPSGVLKATRNPKAAITNQPVLLKATAAGIEANLRFPGQYFDEESNLSYNYFRSYNGSQGRYTQADPIGLAGGLNRFAYVEGDSLSYVDPKGLVKLHGNWCGPDFTGGFSKPYDKLDEAERKAVLPPVDKLDSCCQTHDIAYAACRVNNPCDAKARQQCFENADRTLSQCAADSGSGYGANLLLFGNPKSRIRDYMRDSTPKPEDNAAECSCTNPMPPPAKPKTYPVNFWR